MIFQVLTSPITLVLAIGLYFLAYSKSHRAKHWAINVRRLSAGVGVCWVILTALGADHGANLRENIERAGAVYNFTLHVQHVMEEGSHDRAHGLLREFNEGFMDHFNDLDDLRYFLENLTSGREQRTRP